MEMTVCFLLLLLCSLSTAQLQSLIDNHITDPGEKTEGETADASSQEQICLQDIHAVLRELSASVAEQRVEMRHLQRENEAQEAKLESQRAEVESQRAEVERQKQKNEAQEVKLRDLESQKVEVELQKQKLEEQEAKLESQRAEVESQRAEVERQKVEVEELKQNLQAQSAELVTVKSRTNVTEHQVEALRRGGEVKQVAFSASLKTTSGSQTFGPYNTQTNLVFKHVFSNIGNAYSPDTGVFTAPVRGAYHFEAYISSNGHATVGADTVLVKNGEVMFAVTENQTSGFSKSANGATLLLEVGDAVSMRLWVNAKISDNHYHHCIFSGHLLFTM